MQVFRGFHFSNGPLTAEWAGPDLQSLGSLEPATYASHIITVFIAELFFQISLFFGYSDVVHKKCTGNECYQYPEAIRCNADADVKQAESQIDWISRPGIKPVVISLVVGFQGSMAVPLRLNVPFTKIAMATPNTVIAIPTASNDAAMPKPSGHT